MKTVTYDETLWKLVPIKPTDDMVWAGNYYQPCHCSTSYDEMLKNAPECKELNMEKNND